MVAIDEHLDETDAKSAEVVRVIGASCQSRYKVKGLKWVPITHFGEVGLPSGEGAFPPFVLGAIHFAMLPRREARDRHVQDGQVSALTTPPRAAKSITTAAI